MADSSAKNSHYFLEPFPSDTPAPAPTKTPRGFGGGAVGLGIVAAMIGGEPDRSGPIPIVYRWAKPTPIEEEAYTCVTSHVPGRVANTRVYLDGAGADKPPMNWAPPPPLRGFLSRCCMCGKDLYGLDLFMYRGDEAFCSAECRSQQIMSDELLEKCGSEAAMMTKAPHFDCSLPPCSAPLFFASGVVAA